jgi:putative DNA primase/helicase
MRHPVLRNSPNGALSAVEGARNGALNIVADLHEPTPEGRAVWDFLTATRDEPAFRLVRDTFPDFALGEVAEAGNVARILWGLRCAHDDRAVKLGRPLDEAVAAELRAIVEDPNADPDAREALAWLCNEGAKGYTPRQAPQVARRLAMQWEQAPKPEPFAYSTDADLDAKLGAVEWLWPGYIPKGFPTLLVGQQDGGKSTVAQDFCRTLLNGGRWPNGEPCPAHDGPLLWLDTEGSLAIFRQRLTAWGMPRGRFIFPPDPLQEVSFESARSWEWIEQAIEKFAPPLVVIDALSGAHTTEENSNDGMKPLLKRLCALTQKHGVAAVLIHHLNKGLAGVDEYPLDLNRVRGAGAITQFCRSVLALTVPDKTQPDARRLDVIKLNLARKPPAVGYVLTDCGPAWGSAPEPPKQHRAADDAADFISRALADGARPASAVRDEAIAQGLSDFALKQARKQLGVNAVKSKAPNGGWLWELDPEKEQNG